jgi:hypothetical protein
MAAIIPCVSISNVRAINASMSDLMISRVFASKSCGMDARMKVFLFCFTISTARTRMSFRSSESGSGVEKNSPNPTNCSG